MYIAYGGDVRDDCVVQRIHKDTGQRADDEEKPLASVLA